MNYRMNEEVHRYIERAMKEAYRDGWTAGLLEGHSRLAMLACVVPSSVSRKWILDEADRHAKELLAKVHGND